MIEIAVCIVKLVSWGVLAAKSRYGFLLAALGQIATAALLASVELYWLATYCLLASLIQMTGYHNWRQDEENCDQVGR